MRAGQAWFLALASSLSLGISATHVAAQDLSACGNMYVSAEAMCEYVPEQECIAECTPLSLEAACAADLSVSCDGQCKLEAQASCTVDCSADCQAECTVDPGKLDCSANCQATCGADCEASCRGGKGGAHCEASCKASCSGSCNGKCDVVPPSANCKAKCDASCSGSCKADANFDCQVDCQAKGYAKCEVDLQGGCKLECMENPDGGLFCDGQFVKSDNVDQCVAALEALLDIEVMSYAEGNASCVNGTCKSEGKAGVSCSSLPAGGGAEGALAGLVGLAGALVRRRRRPRH
jgi:MYXO-CTERM domain-containing protein